MSKNRERVQGLMHAAPGMQKPQKGDHHLWAWSASLLSRSVFKYVAKQVVIGCRTGSQHMAQSSQAIQMSAEHANALQAPAQHMMPQASSSPALHQDSSPAPMAVQMAPSMSGDMDMDNVESSADSVIPSMSLQVCGLLAMCCLPGVRLAISLR